MANFKFYLDADVNVRAKRRYDQLVLSGNNISFDEVLEDMKNRDIRDKTRKISPLVVAKDAIIIDCTNLTIEEAVDELEYRFTEMEQAQANFYKASEKLNEVLGINENRTRNKTNDSRL